MQSIWKIVHHITVIHDASALGVELPLAVDIYLVTDVPLVLVVPAREDEDPLSLGNHMRRDSGIERDDRDAAVDQLLHRPVFVEHQEVIRDLAAAPLLDDGIQMLRVLVGIVGPTVPEPSGLDAQLVVRERFADLQKGVRPSFRTACARCR